MVSEVCMSPIGVKGLSQHNPDHYLMLIILFTNVVSFCLPSYFKITIYKVCLFADGLSEISFIIAISTLMQTVP